MNTIDKGDLAYAYSWTAIRGDDARLTGVPDSTLLNRREGYEVLQFINRFCSKHWKPPGPPKSAALKIERMIRDHLPSDVRSHARVTRWLLDNWGNVK